MKMLKNKILLMLFFLPCFMISCDEETITDDTPDQLFRPVNFNVSINGGDVSFFWVPIGGATYSLELSKDSLLFQGLQVFSIEGTNQYSIGDLWSQTRYSARIKAVSIDKTIKDSEYKQITFVTGTENIFYTIAATDIGANQILLKWDKTKSVSQIYVTTGGATDAIIPLSDADKAAGQKLIEGLQAATSYTFKVYWGEMPRGTISVITKAS